MIDFLILLLDVVGVSFDIFWTGIAGRFRYLMSVFEVGLDIGTYHQNRRLRPVLAESS